MNIPELTVWVLPVVCWVWIVSLLVGVWTDDLAKVAQQWRAVARGGLERPGEDIQVKSLTCAAERSTLKPASIRWSHTSALHPAEIGFPARAAALLRRKRPVLANVAMLCQFKAVKAASEPKKRAKGISQADILRARAGWDAVACPSQRILSFLDISAKIALAGTCRASAKGLVRSPFLLALDTRAASAAIALPHDHHAGASRRGSTQKQSTVSEKGDDIGACVAMLENAARIVRSEQTALRKAAKAGTAKPCPSDTHSEVDCFLGSSPSPLALRSAAVAWACAGGAPALAAALLQLQTGNPVGVRPRVPLSPMLAVLVSAAARTLERWHNHSVGDADVIPSTSEAAGQIPLSVLESASRRGACVPPNAWATLLCTSMAATAAEQSGAAAEAGARAALLLADALAAGRCCGSAWHGDGGASDVCGALLTVGVALAVSAAGDTGPATVPSKFSLGKLAMQHAASASRSASSSADVSYSGVGRPHSLSMVARRVQTAIEALKATLSLGISDPTVDVTTASTHALEAFATALVSSSSPFSAASSASTSTTTTTATTTAVSKAVTPSKPHDGPKITPTLTAVAAPGAAVAAAPRSTVLPHSSLSSPQHDKPGVTSTGRNRRGVSRGASDPASVANWRTNTAPRHSQPPRSSTTAASVTAVATTGMAAGSGSSGVGESRFRSWRRSPNTVTDPAPMTSSAVRVPLTSSPKLPMHTVPESQLASPPPGHAVLDQPLPPPGYTVLDQPLPPPGHTVLNQPLPPPGHTVLDQPLPPPGHTVLNQPLPAVRPFTASSQLETLAIGGPESAIQHSSSSTGLLGLHPAGLAEPAAFDLDLGLILS